jgi:hypothetical protein
MIHQRHPLHAEEAPCPDTTFTKSGLPQPVRSIEGSSGAFKPRFSAAC